MKTNVQYKHESDSVLEALGISNKDYSDIAKEYEAIKKALRSEKESGGRTSVIVAKIVEITDTPEEACLLALRLGQERGKGAGKAEAVARMMAAVMASEGIDMDDMPPGIEHLISGMGGDDEHDEGAGPASTGHGSSDRMFQ